MTMTEPQRDSKTRLLDATLQVVRVKGYTATRIASLRLIASAQMSSRIAVPCAEPSAAPEEWGVMTHAP
jgi:hypothetical protein